jgi:hypothetical protein
MIIPGKLRRESFIPANATTNITNNLNALLFFECFTASASPMSSAVSRESYMCHARKPAVTQPVSKPNV